MKRKPLFFTCSIFAILLILISFSACDNSSGKRRGPVVRDTTINQATAYSSLDLDSMLLEKYIAVHQLESSSAEEMRNFYKNRNYHFAWFSPDGPTEQSRAFYNLHNTYIKAEMDSSVYNKKLDTTMDRLLNDTGFTLSAAELTQTELHLTQHFFAFTKEAYEGTIDPSELQWHIPKRKVDAVALLDSLMAKDGVKLQEWEPVNSYYPLLKNKLIEYYTIEKDGGWPSIDLNNKVYRPGDSASVIAEVKKRLSITGDYAGETLTPYFTDELERGLKHAQQRFGLNADGVLGNNTVKQLNIPVKDRIETMLINMERFKWMPKEGSGTRLVANIPEFRLHVFDGNTPDFSMKIVVGKAGHNTVIFTDSLEYVVFNPYWNVPRSIVKNEILPAMQRSSNYLTRNNMEQTGISNGLPVIRQKPGPSNSLGRVKFLFPNNYNIYFHDTPAKSLFDLQGRAFSHGCVRLSDPEKLAVFLLQDIPAWPESRIKDTMTLGQKETWVKLKKKIPVYMVYFTAWVDKDGALNFRDDIYGHDQKTGKLMFKEE